MVFDGAGLPLAERTFSIAPLERSETLVRVIACTLCGSDLHTYEGRRPAKLPSILGHEILGTIEEFGPQAPRHDLNGRELRIGDRVTWTLVASCGRCYFCERQLSPKCEQAFKYGHESTASAPALSGGLAEYCVLAPGTGMFRLDDDLPDVVACPANCATATVAAAFRVGRLQRGEAILILGAGMLGLTACAMARDAGAGLVFCGDLNSDRLLLAAAFGATHPLLVDQQDVDQVIKSATQGRGVDLVLELSGSSAAAAQSVHAARIGGRILWVGAVAPVPPIAIEPELITRRCLSIHGAHNYLPGDLATAVEFLTRCHQRFPFADLVSPPFALRDAERAFERAIAGRTPRTLVIPGKEA